MKNINWRKIVFLSLLALLVGGGVALLLYGQHFMGHAAEGIGEALIIAGVLALTVDGYVKGHLLKEATHDILEYVMGYRLPPEIQSTLKDLASTNVIGRDLHLHYRLSLVKGNPAKMLAEVTLIYQLENLSNKKHPGKQFCYQQADLSPTFLEMRCDSDDKHAKYHWGQQDLSQQLQGQGGKFNLEVSGPDIELQPNGNARKYKFTSKFTLLCPVDSSDFYVFENPTIGALITAEYPDEIDFSGPGAPDNVNSWVSPRVFLVGEQVTVHWRKKTNA